MQEVHRLHRARVVRDDDELRALAELLQKLHEAVGVQRIERRVDLIQHAERARLDLEHREQQGECGHRALATGEQTQVLGPLALRLREDLDARLQRVVAVGEIKLRVPALEERREGLLEGCGDLLEGREELRLGRGVDLLDDLQDVLSGRLEVVALALEEALTRGEPLALVDRAEVHVPERPDVALEGVDVARKLVPARLLIAEALQRLRGGDIVDIAQALADALKLRLLPRERDLGLLHLLLLRFQHASQLPPGRLQLVRLLPEVRRDARALRHDLAQLIRALPLTPKPLSGLGDARLKLADLCREVLAQLPRVLRLGLCPRALGLSALPKLLQRPLLLPQLRQRDLALHQRRALVLKLLAGELLRAQFLDLCAQRLRLSLLRLGGLDQLLLPLTAALKALPQIGDLPIHLIGRRLRRR